MRNDPIESATYIDLLEDFLKTVVGASVFKAYRCRRNLSEWFTITDEAFLLLCLKNYYRQWQYEWMVAENGPPNKVPAPETISPRYNGKTMGTKRSWSNEGMECFNNLAVLVYNDRRESGKEFDQWFLEGMIKSYGN